MLTKQEALIVSFTVIAVFVFFISALMLAHVGVQWITEGYGLHPVVAFPLATILLFMVVFAIVWGVHTTREDEEYIEGLHPTFEDMPLAYSTIEYLSEHVCLQKAYVAFEEADGNIWALMQPSPQFMKTKDWAALHTLYKVHPSHFHVIQGELCTFRYDNEEWQKQQEERYLNSQIK